MAPNASANVIGCHRCLKRMAQSRSNIGPWNGWDVEVVVVVVVVVAFVDDVGHLFLVSLLLS